MHDLPLLLNIAVALAYALVGGVVATRVGLPSIVGYLIAGMAIGPFTPGYVGNQATIGELAELGVVFLMFGVGLHFSFRDLWRVRNIAIPGATVQMVVATALGFLLARSWGWTPGASLILGLAISVASTVVLLRALMDFGALDSTDGRVAVGWLVFQDLATVAILVLLPLVVGGGQGATGGAMAALIAAGRAVAFVALMLLFGARAVPWILRRVVRLKSREMFVLVAITIALGTALASARWFGVSLALGAFIAGVVVSDSPYSHQVNAELLPFRDTFAVLFFVSVGMLVNPVYLVGHWREVLALSALVILGNSAIGAGVSFLTPYPARTGLIVGAGLGQIGEFSFIVGQTGVALGLLDSTQYSLILAGSIVSITVNPFLFRLIEPIERQMQRWPRLWHWLNRHGAGAPSAPDESMRSHVVIVGSGRVGHHLADILGTLDVPRLVVDSDWARIDELTRARVPTLFGDAGNSAILDHAALERARALVITVPDEAAAAIIAARSREVAPGLPVIARAATDHGARQLADLGVTALVRPEFEGGLQILRSTLLALGFPSRRIQAFADDIRSREVTGSHVDDEMTLVRKLAASDLELDWIEVVAGSALAGMTIADANLRGLSGATVVATSRGGALTGNPGPDTDLRPGDHVALIGRPDQLASASVLLAFAIPPAADLPPARGRTRS
ncbi:MAG TPA: cation:proton antiporter [Vicinamibacterales bacterium]|nr:cation:proton antiporter [Vicinamibacterales bacterium]